MSDLQTLNFAAATFQRDPRLLEAGIAAIQAERAVLAGTPRSPDAVPELILNGKRYYRTDDVVEAIAWLSRHDAEEAMRKGTDNE